MYAVIFPPTVSSWVLFPGLWKVGAGSITWYSDTVHTPTSSSTTQHKQASSNSSMTAPRDVFFLPQKPYNIIGSLRDQIKYPASTASTASTPSTLLDSATASAVSASTAGAASDIQATGNADEELLAILRQVKLEKLAGRVGDGDERRGLDAVLDWGKVGR